MNEPTQTQIVLESESVNLEVMRRADLPVIWDDYRNQLEKLKQTALTLKVTSVEQKLEMKLARETRLAIRQLRIEVEKRRKELGEDLLRQTQKINGAAKELKDAMEELEEQMREQEEFAERAEAARIAKLTEERIQKLQEVGATIPVSVGTIPQDQFDRLISDAILLNKAKEEAERKVEEERIAKEKVDAEERERIQAENARLKAEVEAKEKQRQAERAAAEEQAAKERAAAAAKLEQERKERAAVQAKLAEEQRKAEAEAAKLKAEAAERERIIQLRAIEAQRIADEATRAQAAKVAALQKAEAERLAEVAKQKAVAKKAAEAAAKAPDKKKLTAFAGEIRAMQLPSITDAATASKLSETRERFAAFCEQLAATL